MISEMGRTSELSGLLDTSTSRNSPVSVGLVPGWSDVANSHSKNCELSSNEGYYLLLH